MHIRQLRSKGSTLQFSLALGPFIYFYALKITRPEYKFRRKDLLHFSPLLLQLVTQTLAIRDSIKTGAATYQTPSYQQLNPTLQLLAFVSVVIYLYLSHRLIERFYQQLKLNGGDRHRYELSWLHRLLTGFGLLWLLWILFPAPNLARVSARAQSAVTLVPHRQVTAIPINRYGSEICFRSEGYKK